MTAPIANPSPPANDTSAYCDQFERVKTSDRGPEWVRAARTRAIARFAELGFPTLQDEDWRFTNVAPITRLPFRPVLAPTADGVDAAWLDALTFARLGGTRLVFVNGHFPPALSTFTQLEDGVRIGSLAAALEQSPALLEPHLFRLAATEANPFAALNAAFFQDGLFIHVPRGRSVREPVQAVYIAAGNEPGSAAHPRNLVIAEAGSALTWVESYVSLADTALVTNAVTELVADDGSEVEHLKFQAEGMQTFHLAALRSRLGRDSRVWLHSIALGAKLSRTNITTQLAGPGLECILNGLYLTRDDQLADHHMLVEHAQPHCASHEYFNGILADRSKGVFHGRILVQPGAQKTDAKQTNKNLLLSNDATVDTKPQLEIYADDVRCTHGATVGQLDEESIFYCRSRGIGLETARRMLIHAFAGEIIDRIRHPGLRDELDRLTWNRLEEHPLLAGPPG